MLTSRTTRCPLAAGSPSLSPVADVEDAERRRFLRLPSAAITGSSPSVSFAVTRRSSTTAASVARRACAPFDAAGGTCNTTANPPIGESIVCQREQPAPVKSKPAARTWPTFTRTCTLPRKASGSSGDKRSSSTSGSAILSCVGVAGRVTAVSTLRTRKRASDSFVLTVKDALYDIELYGPGLQIAMEERRN